MDVEMETTTPVTKEQLKKLKKLLKPESHRWFQLGFQMRLSMDELKKIEKEGARKPPDVCFMEVLSLFLQKDTSEKKWQCIFDALEDISNNRLKRTLEKQYKKDDAVSEDIEPKKLANILVDATPNWYMFGQSLDIPVTDLKQIRDEKGPDVCFSQMLDLWFNKDDSTNFEVVIEALENISNKVLARKVREEFLTLTEERIVTPEVTWLTGISKTILSREEDTADVIEALGVGVSNWEDLGLALKIKSPLLENIKIECRDRVSDCRREVIKLWLKSGLASWESLCIALAKDFVGHLSLAKKIADAHRDPVPPEANRTPEYNRELSHPHQEEQSSMGSSRVHLVGGSAENQPVAVDSSDKRLLPSASQLATIRNEKPSQPPYSKPVPVENSTRSTLSGDTSDIRSFTYESAHTNNDEHNTLNIDNMVHK